MSTMTHLTTTVWEPNDVVMDPQPIFEFVLEEARVVATNTYANGVTYYQHGEARTLLRTARGRWVWRIESDVVGDTPYWFEAATDVHGEPFDVSRVDGFICRYGSESDMTMWRADIARPLPLT